jgi:ribonuclease HI
MFLVHLYFNLYFFGLTSTHIKWEQFLSHGRSLGSLVRDGCGRVLRNSPDFYLFGFFGVVLRSSNFMLTELYSILQGLIFAKDLDIEEIVCSSDSLLCINLIKDPNL